MARPPKLCCIMVRMGTLVLFMILEKYFQFFIINNNVDHGIVAYGIYYVEVGFFCACFLYFFLNHKWMLIFFKSFLWIYWNDHMVSIFWSVNKVYHIDWFAFFEAILHYCNEGHLLMIYDIFNVFLEYVCWNFVEYFCI